MVRPIGPTETTCCPYGNRMLTNQRKTSVIETKAQPEESCRTEPLYAAVSSFELKIPTGRGTRLWGIFQPQENRVPRRPACMSWVCGEQRKQLRQAFNGNEIEAAKLIAKYDTNGTQTLEENELEGLLRDYNGGRRPKHEDVSFFLAVADTDRDGSISQAEIMYGLGAWYALNHMPKSVGTHMSKYKIGTGGLPSLEDLRSFLEASNELQPITDDEVHFVLHMAISLGATQDCATLEQMRKAVAAWYMNIERGETRSSHLHASAFADLRDLVGSELHLDVSSKPGQAFLCVLLTVTCLVPCSNLLIAKRFPATHNCEHPDISSLLWCSGIAMFSLGGAGGCLFFTRAFQEGKLRMLKIVARCLFAAVLCGNAFLHLGGLMHIFSSTPIRCGIIIWLACQFTFFWLPVFLSIAACVAAPMIYSHIYAQNVKVDQELHGDV